MKVKFKCKECGFSATMIKVSDKSVKICPSCGKEKGKNKEEKFSKSKVNKKKKSGKKRQYKKDN